MYATGFSLGLGLGIVNAMLSQLSGTVLEVAPDHAVVDCGGVGYQVFCPGRVLGGLQSGTQARIYTVLNVREDALTLYGFTEREERQMFQMLVTVNGVGPRIGLALLSSFAPAEVVGAITLNDPAQLSRAPGVGKKLAEKIIVELKDKMKNVAVAAGAVPVQNSAHNDIVSALVNLGYPPKAATHAAEEALKEAPDSPFEVQFKLALVKAA